MSHNQSKQNKEQTNMNSDPKFNQKTQQKTSKMIRNPQKSRKNTSGQASGPCKGSRRAKMTQKEVRPGTLGIPRPPLGDTKITQKTKTRSPKND